MTRYQEITELIISFLNILWLNFLLHRIPQFYYLNQTRRPLGHSAKILTLSYTCSNLQSNSKESHSVKQINKNYLFI